MFRRKLIAVLLVRSVKHRRAASLFALASTLMFPAVSQSQALLTSDHIRLLIEGRIAERLVVLAAAILLLTFGFLSLRTQAADTGTLEANARHLFSFKLRNVGPGIFFSLFGSALLLWSVNTKLDLQFPLSVDAGKQSAATSMQPPPVQGVTVAYGVGVTALSDAKERRHFLASMLTAEHLAVPNRPPLSKTEMTALSKSIQALEPFKAAIVDSEVGAPGAYQWWQKLKRDPRFGSPDFEDGLNDQEKKSLRAIQQLEKDALGESQ
jgi:hypothetical protein